MLSSFESTSAEVRKGYFFLLMTSLLWGLAFVFQKNATDYVDVFVFNFLRFSIAAISLLLLNLLPNKIFLPDPKDIYTNRRIHHTSLFIGIGAGIFMFLGITLQQWGLYHTTVGKSGFFTSLYIVIVPIIAIMIGQRCKVEVWIGMILAILGVYLLGGGASGILNGELNIGDIMILISTLAWAAQVLWLGIFARYANVLSIAIIQMVVVAVLSFVVVLFFGLKQEAGSYSIPNWSVIWTIRYEILYTGVVSSAVAFTLQIFGQRYVPATNAALVMSTESIFALISGILFLGEKVTLASLIGCFCIMSGIIFAQFQGKFIYFKINKKRTCI